jgi:hypothetical protein
MAWRSPSRKKQQNKSKAISLLAYFCDRNFVHQNEIVVMRSLVQFI